MAYDHQAIEARWQSYWDAHRTFRAEIDPTRPKYYVLDMFPYPSGDGLHVGHVEGYTATDIVARYKRLRGYNVLHPMGWDAFGLPAERFAMKVGVHPAVRTKECIDRFRAQLKRLGFSYDWDREISTTDPAYYRWTQWIFLKLWGSWFDPKERRARPIEELPVPSGLEALEAARFRDAHRLAYLEEAPVNWCPDLRIVLANEEVAEHVEAGHRVVRKPMKQWMLRITAYAERLLEDLEGLDWPASVLEMQRNWIGRSEGAEIDFAIAGHDGLDLRVFTTRPDTLFGVTYMVLAPEHPLISQIVTDDARAAVEAYRTKTSERSERERQSDAALGHKTGVDTGARAVHPFTGAQVPIFIADYVLMGYGTGAIMAVPAHDERDHAFAVAKSLPIRCVIEPASGPAESIDVQREAFVGEGVNVNSDFLNGLATPEAKAEMVRRLEAAGAGRGRVTYKLRDWLFSRQRYWGEPFPLVHRPDGTVVAVPTSELPVELPPVDEYSPGEEGEPPLSRAKDFARLPDGSARELNTMPQWAGSCWYYLRFIDPSNPTAPWSAEAERYWMPVDLYIGGVEHAVLHLLYARFWHKVLFDLGVVSTREPFGRLVNQGMILGATFVPKDRGRTPEGKPIVYLEADVEQVDDGVFRHRTTHEPLDIQWDKMSKSRGNVVNPDEVVRELGADTIRLYEMFIGPLEHSAPWQPDGVQGVHRMLQRVYRLAFDVDDRGERPDRLRPLVEGEGTDRQRKLLHRTIDEVTNRMERLAFNTAISALMVFVRDIRGERQDEPVGRAALESFVILLSPFAPHLAEELWAGLGHTQSIAYAPWPTADAAALVEDEVLVVVQVDGKKRAELRVPRDASRDQVIALCAAEPQVAARLGSATPRRVIVVPGKLVNFVL